MNIKVGDTVITNRFEYSPFYIKEMGEDMTSFFGKKGKVTEVWATTLKVHGFHWPISACTKVEPETTTLKPFNLEAALAGKKVVTRSGKEVTHIHYIKDSPKDQDVLAVVGGEPLLYYPNGTFFLEVMNEESGFDLFMAPEIVTRWVNVYEDSGYDSEDIARTIGGAARNYLGTFKIEIPC